MRTRVQKWGNSLALRIPKSFAKEVGLCENLAVDLSVKEGKLVIQPDSEEPLSLDDLLAGIPANKRGDAPKWDKNPFCSRESVLAIDLTYRTRQARGGVFRGQSRKLGKKRFSWAIDCDLWH